MERRRSKLLTVFVLVLFGLFANDYVAPLASRCLIEKDPRSPEFDAAAFNFSHAFGQPQRLCRWSEGGVGFRMNAINDELFPLGMELKELTRVLSQNDVNGRVLISRPSPSLHGEIAVTFAFEYGVPKYFAGQRVWSTYLFDEELRLIAKSHTNNEEARLKNYRYEQSVSAP